MRDKIIEILRESTHSISINDAANDILNLFYPTNKALKDMCETEEYIRKSCLRVLSERQVYGDSYGVPPLEEVVDLVVEMLLNAE
jgi:hypothetical protein